MGKILTYLNISEENQRRDILDAERLLEGMQAIYATAPSGSKKDNFAVPLAEMTKIFIENVKGISPKEQPKEQPKEDSKEELKFEVGDMFYVGKDGKSKIYQVFNIDGQNFTFLRGNKGQIETYEGLYTTDEANNKLKEGKWVKVLKEKQVPKEDEQPKDNKESKEENKPKEEEFIYNIGDEFYLPTLDEYFKITEITNDRVSIRYKKGGMFDIKKIDFLNNIKRKTYIPLNKDAEIKVGDVYYNTERDENLTIKEVNKNNIVVIYEDSIIDIFSINTLKALIKDGYWVKVEDNNESKQEDKNYKVGDKFLWAKENMTFVIDFIKNGELGIIYSDGLTGFLSTEQFEQGLSTGYYKPFVEQSEPKKERKKREPRTKNVPKTKTEQEKTIEHLLDINVDEIEF